MGKLAIEHVLPGQTASRPVTNANGMVLVQAGTVLTESLIVRLTSLGVTSVIVAGGDGGEQPRSREERVQDLERRFAGHDQDEVMVAIKDLVLAQIEGGR